MSGKQYLKNQLPVILINLLGMLALALFLIASDNPMSNRLLPYDTIIKAHEGDPIAIQAVLDRYAGYIRYFSKMNGYYNSDMEDYIRTKLIESLFKFRLDR